MTPEERFERIEETLARIGERHEALAQTVEILGSMQRQNEARLGQLMDSMNRLVNIIASHEERLDNLEQH